MTADDEVRAYLVAHRPEMLDGLKEWVRILSVVAVPEREHDLMRSAHWLAGALRDVGFPTTQIWPGVYGPAVHAAWCEAPGAPTVLVYSHHDVARGQG